MKQPPHALEGIDRPRPLPPDVRARLEQTLRSRAPVPADLGPLAGTDAARPLPAATRRRIEDALLGGRVRASHRRWVRVAGAAAVFVLLAGVVAAGAYTEESEPELGAPLPPGTTTTRAGAATTAAAAGTGTPADPPVAAAGSGVAVAARLTTFSSCDETLEYLKANGLERVTAWGLESGQVTVASATWWGASAAVAGSSFSTTNVQEEGVDEPDVVRTDGSTLFTRSNTAIEVADVSSDAPAVLASIPVSDPSAVFFLTGGRLVVFQRVWDPPPPGGAIGWLHTFVTTFDVTDPADPTVVGEVDLDGGLVDARLVDGRVYAVTAAEPASLPFTNPSEGVSEADALAHNRAAIESSTIDQWIGSAHCEDVSRPAAFSGFDVVSVFTIDPAAPNEQQRTGVLAGGYTVYASTTNVYVTTVDFADWWSWSGGQPPVETRTQIHQFSIGGDRAAYLASGGVAGYLLSQWAMSELDGNLRVATTSSPPWDGDGTPSESAVTVLARDGGTLVPIGSVGGLGLTEQIMGVRFVGPVGYVVTFRRVDPLYVIDLTDPTHPVVRGELKVTGYSSYLHPLGGSRMLGIGQGATEEGQTTGLQLSVLDVGDLDAPALLGRLAIPNSSSDAEADHHAFLYWPEAALVAVPLYVWDPAAGTYEFSVLLARVHDDGTIEEVGRVTHTGRSGVPPHDPTPQVFRSVVIGDRLLTTSNYGVLVSDLTTFADVAWTPFAG